MESYQRGPYTFNPISISQYPMKKLIYFWEVVVPIILIYENLPTSLQTIHRCLTAQVVLEFKFNFENWADPILDQRNNDMTHYY